MAKFGEDYEYKAYKTPSGEPRLRLASVLYLDLLGTTHELRTTDEAAEHLARTRKAYERARDWGNLTPDMPHVSRWFSDNLVLAKRWEERGYRLDTSIGSVAIDGAWIQLALLPDGFIARGGIALDDFYADREMVYGPALIDAYELEAHQALFPRIVLSSDVVAVLRAQLEANAGEFERAMFLTDRRGTSFVHYLAHLEFFEEDPDFVGSLQALEMHKTLIERGLDRFEKKPFARFRQVGKRGVREKYEWLAGYHDYFCNSVLPDELRTPLLIGVSHRDAKFRPFGADIPDPPYVDIDEQLGSHAEGNSRAS